MNKLLIVVSFLIGLNAVQKGGGGEMMVFIRDSGKITAIDVPSHATVGDLFDIAHAAGLPQSTPLSFKGQELNELDAQLSDLGIGAEAELTALPRVFFEAEGAKSVDEYFDIDGRFATLKGTRGVGHICFADKTRIGQVTKMQVRVTNQWYFESEYLWARDTGPGKLADSWQLSDEELAELAECRFRSQGSTFYVSHSGLSDVTIIIDAKERDYVKIIYKDTSSGRTHTVNLGVDERENGFDRWYTCADESEIQICAKVLCEDSQPDIVEFVNFEIVE